MTREQLDAFENWIRVILTLHTEGKFVDRGRVAPDRYYETEQVIRESDAPTFQCAVDARKELEKALGIDQ